MAAFLPQHDDFFRELLFDSDSEGKFDGFELSDDDDTIQNDENINNGDNFSMENWTIGDSVPVDLDFTGAPGEFEIM